MAAAVYGSHRWRGGTQGYELAELEVDSNWFIMTAAQNAAAWTACCIQHGYCTSGRERGCSDITWQYTTATKTLFRFIDIQFSLTCSLSTVIENVIQLICVDVNMLIQQIFLGCTYLYSCNIGKTIPDWKGCILLVNHCTEWMFFFIKCGWTFCFSLGIPQNTNAYFYEGLCSWLQPMYNPEFVCARPPPKLCIHLCRIVVLATQVSYVLLMSSWRICVNFQDWLGVLVLLVSQ